MLPRNRRLQQQDHPDEKGEILHSPFFVVRYWKIELSIQTVFRVVVSKKISKQAVTRNKIKRRVHEAIYPLLPSMQDGFMVVFNTKQPIIDASFQDVKSDVSDILKKINVIK